MDAGVDTIPDHSPGGSRCVVALATNSSISTQTSVHNREGLGRRRRCVTTSALPDYVALDAAEEEEDEDGEAEKPQDSEDVLRKDSAGVEGSLEMRVRSKTSPASMRWYVERQVGRHLRRISDDFVSHLPRLIRTDDSQQPDIRPNRPDIRSDSHQLPVADVIAPPPPVSSSRDSLWRRFAAYFRPGRTRMQSDRVNMNDSNSLATEDSLEVLVTADIENSRTVAIQ